MALSKRTGGGTSLFEVIIESIDRVDPDGNGAPKEAMLTDATTHASGYSRVDVEDKFETMKRRGEIYVVPADGEDRVKVARL